VKKSTKFVLVSSIPFVVVASVSAKMDFTKRMEFARPNWESWSKSKAFVELLVHTLMADVAVKTINFSIRT